MTLTEFLGKTYSTSVLVILLSQNTRSIGPVDLTQGTLSTNELVPTVTDNLFAQKTIPTNSIGISYEPTTASPDTPDAPGVMNGELTFGGTDSSKFTGSINYV